MLLSYTRQLLPLMALALLVGTAAAQIALMDLERPDGLRLLIQPATGADVLALAERFMEV